MANKTYTIVYVFGPKRCEKKYKDNEILDRTIGEWVKIGETSTNKKIEDITPAVMMEESLKRCNNESRTGIPEVSSIYDVFIFPYRIKTDLQIRMLLCNDIYTLENTGNASKLAGEGVIAPGTEFVYGVCRNHIKHAVESFDHDLIVNAKDDELFEIRSLCIMNNISIDEEDSDEAEDSASDSSKERRPNRNLDKVLQIGSVVSLTDSGHAPVLDETGAQITAIYRGNNSFECKGETMKGSPLALKYINLYTKDKNGQPRNLKSVNGNSCWTYEGKVLWKYFE